MPRLTARNLMIGFLWFLVALSLVWFWLLVHNHNQQQKGKDWLVGYQQSLAHNAGASSWDNACGETMVSWICDINSMEADAPHNITVETGLEDADSVEAWRYARSLTMPDWTDNDPATDVTIMDRHGNAHYYSKRKVDEGYDG